MDLNVIGRLFMPKNKVFYKLFEQVADNIEEMGKLIKAMVAETNADKRNYIAKKIEDFEHKNDDQTHAIFTELSRNFITPFDREDIHYLASALDDIADYIFSSSKKIIFYNIDPSDEGIQKMADLINQSCLEIKKIVYCLRDMKELRKMTDSMVKIKSLETMADDVFDISIDRLFQLEEDFKAVIKRRDIYQVLEDATDKCEDAANVIESIIIKYA